MDLQEKYQIYCLLNMNLVWLGLLYAMTIPVFGFFESLGRQQPEQLPASSIILVCAGFSGLIDENKDEIPINPPKSSTNCTHGPQFDPPAPGLYGSGWNQESGVGNFQFNIGDTLEVPGSLKIKELHVSQQRLGYFCTSKCM